MRALLSVLIPGLAIAYAGCGGPAPEPSPEAIPLTVAEWKLLPAEKKYSAQSMERLKVGDPALQTDAGWDRFQKNVLAAERKRDRNDPQLKK